MHFGLNLLDRPRVVTQVQAQYVELKLLDIPIVVTQIQAQYVEYKLLDIARVATQALRVETVGQTDSCDTGSGTIC